MNLKQISKLAKKIGGMIGITDIKVIPFQCRYASLYLPLLEWIHIQKDLSNEEAKATLYHEIGHLFLSRYPVFNNKRFKTLFGDTRKGYFGSWYWTNPEKLEERIQEKPGYASWYAQVHPMEDWAETFALALEDYLSKEDYVYEDKLLGKKVKFVRECLEIACSYRKAA